MKEHFKEARHEGLSRDEREALGTLLGVALSAAALMLVKA